MGESKRRLVANMSKVQPHFPTPPISSSVGWADLSTDFTGWGELTFPIDALRQGHTDGFSMADFAEAIRHNVLDLFSDEDEEDFYDSEFKTTLNALISMGPVGCLPADEHPLRDLANQILEEHDQVVEFVRFVLAESQRGFTLADLANKAEKENWCRW